jgi:hypothetical protein
VRNARAGAVRERWIGILLVLCAGVVAFWEIMANRSRRSRDPFQIAQSDFVDFRPRDEAWHVRAMPIGYSRHEPNILSYEVKLRTDPRNPADARPVQVRLVHGYNMPDCMRLKYYRVELLSDSRKPGLADDESPGPLGPVRGEGRAPAAEGGNAPRPMATPEGASAPQSHQVQIWRLTSGGGDASVWVTSMLRVGDFAETGVDIRSMAFPRVGIPDDPNWAPRGLTVDSLKHPIRDFRRLMRVKWNNAHCDLFTFLKWKHPAWASDELLSLVSASLGDPVPRGEEERAIRGVLAAHLFLHSELRAWRRAALAAPNGDEVPKRRPVSP